jgi:sporulation protein YlmC with PRC-barrel domain
MLKKHSKGNETIKSRRSIMIRTARSGNGRAIIAGAICLGIATVVQATDTNNVEQHVRRSGKTLVFASNIIGQTVRNQEGLEIGHVAELVINTDGRVQYSIVSVGKGFLGIGNKRVEIPWQDMALSATQEGYVLNVSKDALVGAPDYSEQTEQTSSRETGEYRTVSREGQTYQGKVVAVNPDTHIITVRQSMVSHDFILGDSVRADAANVGDYVVVTYTTDNGQKIVQSIQPSSK